MTEIVKIAPQRSTLRRRCAGTKGSRDQYLCQDQTAFAVEVAREVAAEGIVVPDAPR
jgi:hypothetical protein